LNLPRIRGFWQRLNFADVVACVVVLAYLLLAFFGPHFGPQVRVPTLWLSRILLVLGLGYLAIRLLGVRTHWLWSLRNQLIAVYFFVSILPILLQVVMTALAFYLLYWHFGAYLVYADLERRIEQVAATADTLTTAYALEIASTGAKAPIGPISEPPPRTAIFLAAAQENLPGLKIEVGAGQELLARATDRRHLRFAGLVADRDAVELRAVVERRVNGQQIIVSTEVPVTPELLATLEPEFGPIEVITARPTERAGQPGVTFPSRGRVLAPVRDVRSTGQVLAPRRHWFDYSVTGFSRLDAVNLADASNSAADVPVILRFTARASELNGRLIAVVGEWGGIAVTALLVVGAMFVLIEFAALAGSISLTRSITRSVNDLYQATRYVESGDFGHRIQTRHRDQLGALGESFNSMTESVSTLISEQQQRQRLEHELAIAREVQAQLFPKEKPTVQGVEIEAVCRPARVVSGDYYDFLPLGPGRLGIALADISGKGISAALIMASLQAALRSQAMFNGRGPGSTAEIVTRLNQHLYRSTAADRFATFFYGVYDAQTHRLEYTNAGHPAPLCISGKQVQRLSVGGTVLGLFDDRQYESQIVDVAPGSLLIAYSDGLTEAENPDGEEFEEQRVLDVALRMGQAPTRAVLKNLLEAVDHWTGPAEQSDDITLIVARF
jgi:sigma-B regulation protein RsbU (phosphoserine phosphatase)